MRRPFPTLALVAVLLMVAALASGLAASARGHTPLGALAVGATLVAYGCAFAAARSTSRRVDRLASACGMPDWVGAQAEKNRRKVGAYLPWGLALLGLSAWSGWSGGPGHGVVSASNLAFQAGASAGLVVVMRAQAGLLRDVEARARSARPTCES